MDNVGEAMMNAEYTIRALRKENERLEKAFEKQQAEAFEHLNDIDRLREEVERLRGRVMMEEGEKIGYVTPGFYSCNGDVRGCYPPEGMTCAYCEHRWCDSVTHFEGCSCHEKRWRQKVKALEEQVQRLETALQWLEEHGVTAKEKTP